uniref:MADS-box domain-containing protein n=1 Tax=Kalanchoe fedtschenkoi TaxID=63787 RepID=A0A7N0TNL8_KALFE
MATAAPPKKKRPQGGKKIEMKLVEKKSNRNVTFSKRRSSLFEKASELCTLSGAHVAIMIFSPAGKIYSFGSPSVEAVVQRYEAPLPTGGSSQPHSNSSGLDSWRVAVNRVEGTRKLKTELSQTLESIECEKVKSQILDAAWERDRALWWNNPAEEMDLTRCKVLEQKLMELKMRVDAEVKNRPPEDYEKVLDGHDYLSAAIPLSLAHLMPNHASVCPSNDFMSWWINNIGATPSNYIILGPNNAANVSPINFPTGMYNFGGSSASNFGPMSSSRSTAGVMNPGFGPNSSYCVGPSSRINFTG